MKLHGRIALCGMISVYNDASRTPGPVQPLRDGRPAVRMEGFLVFDFAPHSTRRAAISRDGWPTGKLEVFVDVQEGFENIPKTFMRIFTGENIGKQMLKIADPQSRNLARMCRISGSVKSSAPRS